MRTVEEVEAVAEDYHAVEDVVVVEDLLEVIAVDEAEEEAVVDEVEVVGEHSLIKFLPRKQLVIYSFRLGLILWFFASLTRSLRIVFDQISRQPFNWIRRSFFD